MAEMTDGERIAEGRIAEAARTGQDWLDLGDLGLEKLPDALSKLTKLKRLSLGSVFQVNTEGMNVRSGATDRSSLSDISAVSSLSDLRELLIDHTNCNDLSPIAGLRQLQTLNCGGTQVSDLSPIAGLQQLQKLDCSFTQVSDLAPIARLQQLQELDCSFTHLSNLSPTVELQQLQELDISGCTLAAVPDTLWRLPSLKRLWAWNTFIPGIPNEVLGWACLERLRAHLADLEAGAVHISEAKLLILGNGRAGKTQITRRLAGQPFQAEWDSTHGIRITQVILPAQDSLPETRLKLWDFGGQEIYHGTHALFARTRAIFLLVWSQETELPAAEPDQYGMVFRNHPLRYWHAYAKDAGHKGSPLIIAQTRHDQDGMIPPPLDHEQMASSTCVQVSTADPPRINTLRGALQDAVVALHHNRGAVEIGKPRLILQRRIEALRQADGSLPEAWRLMEKSTFAAWYQEAGGTASAEFALAYLNDNGTVFYRAGLFQDRIVLDQNWAMAAIYALFDRKETYGRLKRRSGLFERAYLAQVWQDYSEAEQRLFLSMMKSCGICFVYREDETEEQDDDTTVYVAPEFLPEKAVVQGQIEATWGEGPATHRQVFTYAFLHEGLIRNVISQLGTLAQTRADYFRGGVCLYDAQTRARALVTQHLQAGEWQGSVSIETKDGDAATLLERLAKLVSEENRKLNLSATTDKVMPVREAPAPQAPVIQAARPPEERPKYAISYAWNKEGYVGPDLEAPIDLLCDAAKAKQFEILRDKQNMTPGDRIRTFRLQIARSPRIFVFLSDRYLESLNCMAELYEIWRECDRNEDKLRDKIRIFKFPNLQLSDPVIRAGYRDHWARKYDEWNAANVLSPLSIRERDDFRIIEDLRGEDLGNLLYLFNDIIRHDAIEDFIDHAFD
jgi:internalin A